MGDQDPFWAILSDPAKRHRRWDQTAFFATGEAEISQCLELLRPFGIPERTETAVDFGCGLGRVTQALANRFGRCIGLDISESMVAQATTMNRAPNCEFAVNLTNKLPYASGTIDFVYCRIVLQHISSTRLILDYVSEFIRVLAPAGALVMQIPSHIPPRYRLQIRPRAYGWLRGLGLSPSVLCKMGLHPIRMNFVPERTIRDLVASSGGVILRAIADSAAGAKIKSRTYIVTKSA